MCHLMTAPPLRLWLYLTLVVNGILLTVLLGFGGYSAHVQSQAKYASILRDTHFLSQNIMAGSANELLLGRLDTLEETLLGLVILGAVQEITLADAQGRILVSVVRGSANEGRVRYAALNALLDTTRPEAYVGSDYLLTKPINRGETIGWIRIRTSMAELESIRRNIWRDTLFTILLSSLASGALLIWVLRRTSRAIEHAAQFAADIVKLRGARRNSRSWIVEIRQLHDALNEASGALDRQIQTLQDSEARKSAVLKASLDALITIDARGCIVDFNPAAETIFGWRHEEVIGVEMGEIIVPHAHRANHARGMRHYLNTGIGSVLNKRIELTALRRSGEEFPVELSIAPFQSGGEQYFLGSLRDISAQKQLEANQLRTAAMLRQTVSELAAEQYALDEHAIVSITDPAGTITYANEKFCQASQYALDELLGQNHRILKSGLHDAAFYGDMWTTIRRGEVWHGVLVNRCKDGDLLWMAATIVPMMGDDGLPRQYIAIRTDITHQKRQEQQIDLYRMNLEKMIESERAVQLDLDRARARELAIGHNIQRTLLFANVPENQGALSLATFTEPSKGIDGDFYEFLQISEDRFDVSIGDVMGKGINAALIGAAVKQQMSRSMGALQLQNMPGVAPDIEALVNDIHRNLTPCLVELESFVTLAYLRVDMTIGEIELVDAGHTQTILVGDEGCRLLTSDNLPIGVIEDEYYSAQRLAFPPNTLAFLYSDGFSEAQNENGEMFGGERLADLVQDLHRSSIPMTMLVQSVRMAVYDFEQRKPPSDDRTCIALKHRPLMEEVNQCSDLNLPWRLDGLAALRQSIEKQTQDAGFSEVDSAAFILAAFEAATNVIRHAEPILPESVLHARLRTHADWMALELFYIGSEAFEPQDSEPDFSGESEGGFGLFIIRNSVDEVRYDVPAPWVCCIHLGKRMRRANGRTTQDDRTNHG
jgi:PAS domain S-box-containing protein